jgi:uncharacterized protein (TIRG00374 family)
MYEERPKLNLGKSLFRISVVLALVALAGWLLGHENFYRMFEVLRGAKHSLVGAAIAIYFVSVGIWAIRWQVALFSTGGVDHKVNFGTLYLILCSTIFLNNITPVARAGGDPFGRVYLLSRLENVKYSSGMAASLSEHAFAPLCVASCLIGGLFLKFGRGSLEAAALSVAAWGLMLVGTTSLPRCLLGRRVAAKRLGRIMIWIVGRFRKQDGRKVIDEIERFYSAAHAVIGKWKVGFFIAGLTFMIWALDVLRFYIVFLALGYGAELALLLLASSLPVIIGVIPLLPGGLVLTECSLISLFTLFSVPLSVGIAATVIERGISYVLSTAVGAGVFLYLGPRAAIKPER